MMADSFVANDSNNANSRAPSAIERIGAVAAIIGGILRIVAAFIPFVPQYPALESLYAIIDLCLLFGLGAIYLPNLARFGRLGIAGYLIASAGLASIVGPDTPMFGVDFYLMGSAIFEIGLLLLGFTMIRGRQYRATGWLWIISAASAIAVALGGGEVALLLAGTSLGLGFALGGYQTQISLPNGAERHMAFNQVTIGCSDLTQSIAFYQALGFELIVNSPQNGYARFEAPNGTTLSLHKGLGVPAMAVLYFERQDLDQWFEKLSHKGVIFDQAPTDQSWGWREARLSDPAGNPLCLFTAGQYRRFPPWRVN